MTNTDSKKIQRAVKEASKQLAKAILKSMKNGKDRKKKVKTVKKKPAATKRPSGTKAKPKPKNRPKPKAIRAAAPAAVPSLAPVTPGI